MPSRPRAPWPLVAVFTAGYLAAYLLPTVVGRLSAGLGLAPAQAGLVGSALLLCSAAAGFTLASRVERYGQRRTARAGLLLAVGGYGLAALATSVPLVVAGASVGGLGSGTATAVAAAGIAGRRDPHRASTLGLLSVSATAGALYLTIPHLGGGHTLPFASLALVAAVVWPATARLETGHDTGSVRGTGAPLPRRRSGAVLAGTILCWSMAQNALWGVSGRIGLTQAGLGEVTVGAVFAAALGAGLLGVTAAGALGARLGRAVPIGVGTVVIAGCIAVSSAADDLVSFASGEILWNACYPVVLSYLIGLAASLDPRGRWAVLVGSASSLGVACGPVTGSVLSEAAGYPGMGLVLGGLLLLIAVPMTAVALHTSGRPLVPGAVRRRGGAPAAVVAATTGTATGLVPQIGAPEQPVAEFPVPSPARRHSYRLARPSGGAR
ncbi:MFS transporter [Streptomyces sp. SP18CS02]|uniref:MFS transporter n=1 Tax=Streptomyces sp. SP18CS02 TaxID=3002531 RepID=UPI002E788973|nr:MFS transporter [Streptomyces sp. SP18CS02]MEE1753426.1 MFS transporter [Streptomyces sp. SP18CS02]